MERSVVDALAVTLFTKFAIPVNAGAFEKTALPVPVSSEMRSASAEEEAREDEASFEEKAV